MNPNCEKLKTLFEKLKFQRDQLEAMREQFLRDGNPPAGLELLEEEMEETMREVEPFLPRPINLKEFFRTGKTGKEKQRHSDNFKKLISSLEKSEVSLEREPQVFILPKDMNDFQIRDHIGEEKLIWPSKEKALAVLASTMTDAYRDGRANIVYYKDASGALSYARVYWDASDVEWNCIADQANALEWLAGNRVFYPAT